MVDEIKFKDALQRMHCIKYNDGTVSQDLVINKILMSLPLCAGGKAFWQHNSSAYLIAGSEYISLPFVQVALQPRDSLERASCASNVSMLHLPDYHE